MKRIEMLTDVKEGDGYFKGEIRMVSPERAGYFCGVGWARDLGGEFPTAEPDLSDKKLDVQGGKHGQKAANVGAN